jgi:ppGpp synthetase/RelA/SpoT-type nucleotidyltranferase
MNFDDYEKRYEAAYAEFAAVVRVILEKAIAASSDIPVPQSIQYRAKEAMHLRPKLQDRGLLESQSIEEEIKDLAGARLIFYTNTDVDRFLNSRLIPENFEIHWDETKIHHPTEENARQRYQAVHYTVSLNPARVALPEYAKFKGMRCELQIQTILNHAWAETSHDMLYKPALSKGFGSKAMQSIEKRMMRIMDEHLLPAGYELQKVQHDFDRLMQGKALFDRGAIEALETCNNNNDRHDILSTIKEYVLPNYDDIEGIYPELRRALLKAFDDSRNSEVQPIETPFGNLSGNTAEQVTALVVDILDNLRYVDVEGTFQALAHLYQREPDSSQRKEILRAIEQLSGYNLHVWQQVGPGIQMALTNVIHRLSPAERVELGPVLLAVWRQFLDPELRGTSFSADAFTLSSGAVPASDDLREIRDKAITGLLECYDRASTETEKRSIITSLWEATRQPNQGAYSNELFAMVINDTKRIVEELTAHSAGELYEILEHLENRFLYQYNRGREIVAAEDDRFGCKNLAESLVTSIRAFRDTINADPQFVRYKTLVGYESVVPSQWEDDSDYNAIEEYRRARIEEYVEAISPATEDEWYATIERCAATKSNDMATFPLFGEFLVLLGRRKPETADRFLLRANDDLLNFMPAFLKGLYDSGHREIYRRTIIRYLAANAHLAAIARQCRMSKPDEERYVQAVLDKAIAIGDDIAVIECLVGAIANHQEEHQPEIDDFFVPAIKYLTEKKDARWINGAWFLPQVETFFGNLSSETTELVLDNLLVVQKIEAHAERILCCIAGVHPRAVWKFFGRRLTLDPEHDQQDHHYRYEPVPYRFFGLEKQLAKDAEAAVGAVRDWYSPDDPLFEFQGAQLLHAVFPAFPEPFGLKLKQMAADGSDGDIGFTLAVLRKFTGEPAIHDVVKQLVARLPADDPRLMKVEIALQNTGVVSGEFGFAETYRRKKSEIASWLDDDRPRIREFTEQFMTKLDRMIAAEQRRAEQGRELRLREFEAEDAKC